jgi:hypothetical protein
MVGEIIVWVIASPFILIFGLIFALRLVLWLSLTVENTIYVVRGILGLPRTRPERRIHSPAGWFDG